jgi:opacity protein-like surface antigen
MVTFQHGSMMARDQQAHAAPFSPPEFGGHLMKFQFARNVLAGAALAAGLAVVAPQVVNAQGMGFVVQGNYGGDSEIGVGAGVNFGLGSLTAKQGIRGEATFDYYFPGNNLNYWELNGNLLLDIKSVVGLYVGAGVNYAKYSYDCGSSIVCDLIDTYADNSQVGLNALAGYSFGGAKSPFVQAKIELGGGEQFVVTGGIRF